MNADRSPLNLRLVVSVLAAAMLAAPLPGADAPVMRFPGKDWEVVKPEAERIDAAKLAAAVDYLKANAGKDGVRELVVVRRGRVVWHGDDIDKVHSVWLCTTSFTSAALGLLIDDGKCSLDTKAADVLPDLKALYPDVTLRHFATMTSGCGPGDRRRCHERVPEARGRRPDGLSNRGRNEPQRHRGHRGGNTEKTR